MHLGLAMEDMDVFVLGYFQLISSDDLTGDNLVICVGYSVITHSVQLKRPHFLPKRPHAI